MSLTRIICVLGLSFGFVLTGCPANSSHGDFVHGDGDGGGAKDADGGEPEADAGPKSPHPDPDAGDHTSDPGKPSDPDSEPGDHDGDDDPSDPTDPTEPSGDDDPGSPQAGGATRLFLPTGDPDNTRGAKVLIDSRGDLHAIYPAYAGGDAYYAFCPNNCSDPDALQVVRLETDGTVLNAMLVLTRADKPRVLLATGLNLVWAECDDECTAPASWQSSTILDHGGDRDVTGNALALDTQDHPRFVMHTYLALLGVGQKTPQTFYAQCDADCGHAESWQIDVIQDQIWQTSQLRFDAAGRAHLATVAVTFENGVPTSKMGAYLVCEAGCTTADDWSGIGLGLAYESYSEEISPAIALALTRDGGPRIVMLGKSDTGLKDLLYFECDDGCDQDNWRATLLSERNELGAGVDIALDDRDRPRFVFTLDDNIGLYYCDDADCIAQEATWNLTKIEFASDLPPDNIILWPNCTVDAWVLHDPSIALGKDASVRVGYQATDLSGGGGPRTDDPTKPACLAGADMTLSRLAMLPSYAE